MSDCITMVLGISFYLPLDWSPDTGSPLQQSILLGGNQFKSAHSWFLPSSLVLSASDSTKSPPVDCLRFIVSVTFSKILGRTQRLSLFLVRFSLLDIAQQDMESVLPQGRLGQSLPKRWSVPWETEGDRMLGWIMSWRFLRCSCTRPNIYFVIFRLLGIFTSLLIPETKRKTLEELTGEDHWLHIETTPSGGNLTEDMSENGKAEA